MLIFFLLTTALAQSQQTEYHSRYTVTLTETLPNGNLTTYPVEVVSAATGTPISGTPVVTGPITRKFITFSPTMTRTEPNGSLVTYTNELVAQYTLVGNTTVYPTQGNFGGKVSAGGLMVLPLVALLM